MRRVLEGFRGRLQQKVDSSRKSVPVKVEGSSSSVPVEG